MIVSFFVIGTYVSNRHTVTQHADDIDHLENTEATNKSTEDSTETFQKVSTIVTDQRKKGRKKKGRKKGKEQKQEQQDVSLTLDNFHRSEIRDGKKHWEIKARRAIFDPKTGKTTVESAEVWLYRDNGDIVYLTSKDAHLLLESGIFKEAHLLTDITLKVNDEMTLTANKAHYNHEKQTVEVPGHVTITGEMYTITGKRLLADLTTEEFTLVKDVKSVITPKSSKQEGA